MATYQTGVLAQVILELSPIMIKEFPASYTEPIPAPIEKRGTWYLCICVFLSRKLLFNTIIIFFIFLWYLHISVQY